MNARGAYGPTEAASALGTAKIPAPTIMLIVPAAKAKGPTALTRPSSRFSPICSQAPSCRWRTRSAPRCARADESTECADPLPRARQRRADDGGGGGARAGADAIRYSRAYPLGRVRENRCVSVDL